MRREWLNVARTLEVGPLRRAFTIILPAAAPTPAVARPGLLGRVLGAMGLGRA